MIAVVVVIAGATAVSYVLKFPQPEDLRSPQEAQEQTKRSFAIKGRTINSSGEIVAGATVFVDADGPKAGRVATGVSDEQGNFSVTLHEIGDYTVYGSKEEDGYALTVSAFHKQVTLEQIPKLHITELMNVENVTLQLDQSAAKIEGRVKDVLNGRGVKSASITLRRTEDPELLYRTSTDYANPGKFKIVVPTDPFTITVESPGYQPWVYGDDGPLARTSHSMTLNRGEVRKLEVGLRKAANQ
jgi:hypothetical protein